MSGKSTGFHDVMGTVCTAAENGGARSGLAMLDGTDSAARLVFTSSGRRRRTAVLDRWLAVVRICPAAGIVDAARVRVTGRRIGKHARLRTTIDTRMWGLSATPGEGDGIAAAAGPKLSIMASAVLRPLEFAAVSRWL
jgi:hypothetical protein